MIVGHTKFSPDWCFGLLKQRLRRCRVDCLDDLVKVVESSADVNSAQLVETQLGETVVPMYNWAQFFEPHYKTLQQIKTFHHFHFSCTTPGEVTVKQYSDSDNVHLIILKDNWKPHPSTLPSIITPPGLSEERQIYLYEKIRPFCREEVRDITCPRPLSLQQPSLPTTPNLSQSSLQSSPHQILQKRPRTCSQCGKQGHNKRRCHL